MLHTHEGRSKSKAVKKKSTNVFVKQDRTWLKNVINRFSTRFPLSSMHFTRMDFCTPMMGPLGNVANGRKSHGAKFGIYAAHFKNIPTKRIGNVCCENDRCRAGGSLAFRRPGGVDCLSVWWNVDRKKTVMTFSPRMLRLELHLRRRLSFGLSGNVTTRPDFISGHSRVSETHSRPARNARESVEWGQTIRLALGSSVRILRSPPNTKWWKM